MQLKLTFSCLKDHLNVSRFVKFNFLIFKFSKDIDV